jgi:serine/threonine protein kinase
MSQSGGDFLGIDGITDAVRVGQGSYGTVYQATQPAYARTVAVKVLTEPFADDDARRRFARECMALGSLSTHPFIVTLYAAGITDEGRPYLMMAFLPGGSLAARLGSGGPLEWQAVADIGVKMAGALATAHGQGILHRDIKPENILVSAYGEPELADFGVAKIQGGTATSSATITGSLAHASPEVISGVPATVASDIWSLASTLATLLSGHPPFYRAGDETLAPLISRILTQPPERLPSQVPEPLCALIERGLAKDSWERPQTAVEFGQALQQIQRDLGVSVTALPAAPSPAVESPESPPAESPPEAEAVPSPVEQASSTIRREKTTPGPQPAEATIRRAKAPAPPPPPPPKEPDTVAVPVVATADAVAVATQPRDLRRWRPVLLVLAPAAAVVLLVALFAGGGGGRGKPTRNVVSLGSSVSTRTTQNTTGATTGTNGSVTGTLTNQSVNNVTTNTTSQQTRVTNNQQTQVTNKQQTQVTNKQQTHVTATTIPAPVFLTAGPANGFEPDCTSAPPVQAHVSFTVNGANSVTVSDGYGDSASAVNPVPGQSWTQVVFISFPCSQVAPGATDNYTVTARGSGGTAAVQVQVRESRIR